MYIHEAIQKASKHKVGIQRREWRKVGLALIPTDSAYLGMFIVTNNGKEGSRNWNPTATDLIANDWELFLVSAKKAKRQNSFIISKYN